jgi:hypothetical protein
MITRFTLPYWCPPAGPAGYRGTRTRARALRHSRGGAGVPRVAWLCRCPPAVLPRYDLPWRS